LCGILDGHGGEGAADFVRAQLKPKLEEIFRDGRLVNEPGVGNAFTQAFHQLACDYQKKYPQVEGQREGTTVCCALQIGNRLYLANAGDSRALLIRDREVFQLTKDAVPGDPAFDRWHIDRGHQIVTTDNHQYVRPSERGAMLGVARAVGGFSWQCPLPKQGYVTIGDQRDNLRDGRLFCRAGDLLVFVTDGITNRLTKQALSNAIHDCLRGGMDYKAIAQEIVRQVGAAKKSDNASILIVPISERGYGEASSA
jgi:serine/threonine protein phosphatase PrpC